MRHVAALLFSLSLCLLFGCGSGAPRAPKSAGEKAFDSANFLITSSRDGVAHGNTAEAKKIAAQFSETLGTLQQAAFTGGDKNRKFSLTGEKFLVYCQLANDKVCFLVHVPQLKNYKDEVRTMLARLAFKTAEAVTADLHKEKPISLAVGLRGSLIYGASAIGKSGAEPRIEQSFSVPQEPFYPYFETPQTAAPAAVAPKATEPKDATKESKDSKATQPK